MRPVLQSLGFILVAMATLELEDWYDQMCVCLNLLCSLKNEIDREGSEAYLEDWRKEPTWGALGIVQVV